MFVTGRADEKNKVKRWVWEFGYVQYVIVSRLIYGDPRKHCEFDVDSV